MNAKATQKGEAFVIEKESARAHWNPWNAKKEWGRIIFWAAFWVFWFGGTIQFTVHGFSKPSHYDNIALVWGWIFSAYIPFYFINALLPAGIESKGDEIIYRKRTMFGERMRAIPIREITQIGFRLRGRGSQSTLTIVSKGSFFWAKKENIGDFLSLELKQQLFALLCSWVTVEKSPVSYFPYGG
jgi:hypothetical protein